MIASVINAILIFIGSALGMVFKSRIKEEYSKAIITGLGLCVLLIGISSAIGTNNMLCVIICMVFGIVIGEVLRIEDRLDNLGERLKQRLMKGRDGGRFNEGFMGATLIFCVGSMAVMGSMEAGLNHNYSIILSKSVIDCVTAVTLAAALGVGVLFSGFTVLIYQGLLTLLAMWVGPVLPDAAVTEMSAVGGLLIVALAVNMLGLAGDRKLRVGNMLPAVFLPIAYIPLENWIRGLFS
ncbi:MAG: DUF554 domain-containing protein [Oscillospiraceae bacterium]|jgi:uncharacterized membrane protein YqgA involved in biofilm formation